MPEFSTLTPVQHLSDARSVNLPFCQGKNRHVQGERRNIETKLRHVQGERRNIETKLSHKWPGPPETGTMCLHPWPGPNLTPDSSTLALWVRLFHCAGVCLWQTDQHLFFSFFFLLLLLLFHNHPKWQNGSHFDSGHSKEENSLWMWNCSFRLKHTVSVPSPFAFLFLYDT